LLKYPADRQHADKLAQMRNRLLELQQPSPK
jgi:hypothetical protein